MNDINLIEVANNSRASQNKKELQWLLEKVSKINPKRVLEIGVHKGYSLEVWRKAFGKDCIIAGIDNDLRFFDKSLGPCELYLIEQNSHSEKTLELTKHFFADLPIDFLFIDGDHMYNSVKSDFELYSPLVRKGGIIAFHDATLKDNPSVEVYKFIEEIQNKYTYEYMTGFLPGEADGIQQKGTGTFIIFV